MSSQILEKVVNSLIAAVFLAGAFLCKMHGVDGVYELCLIASGVSGALPFKNPLSGLSGRPPKAE